MTTPALTPRDLRKTSAKGAFNSDSEIAG